jgi:type III secretory pathway component EscU
MNNLRRILGEIMQRLTLVSLIIAASMVVAAVSAVPVVAIGEVCTTSDLTVKCNGEIIPTDPVFPILFSCIGLVEIECCGNGSG